MKLINAINAEAKAAGIVETILVGVCYAGHGIQDGYNHVLLNQRGDPDNKGTPA